MKVTLDSLFNEALTLSDESRLELVERLIPTIESEASLEIDQLKIVQTRVAEVESGRVKLIPGEQVFQKIQASLASRRGA